MKKTKTIDSQSDKSFMDSSLGRAAALLSGQIAGLGLLLQDKGIATPEELKAYMQRGEKMLRQAMEKEHES